MRLQVWSLALLSGLGSGIAMSCGVVCRCGLDPELLGLWGRLVATAPIRPLVWESPYAMGEALENTKKRKKERKRERGGVGGEGREEGRKEGRKEKKSVSVCVCVFFCTCIYTHSLFCQFILPVSFILIKLVKSRFIFTLGTTLSILLSNYSPCSLDIWGPDYSLVLLLSAQENILSFWAIISTRFLGRNYYYLSPFSDALKSTITTHFPDVKRVSF